MEKKFNSTFDIYNDKLTNIRMENTKYAEDIKKATGELLKQINFLVNYAKWIDMTKKIYYDLYVW